ncbi:hypothetical protein NB704_004379 [Pantoea ananatis]|nr:hypothetical protein [Pantoea ananatis]
MVEHVKVRVAGRPATVNHHFVRRRTAVARHGVEGEGAAAAGEVTYRQGVRGERARRRREYDIAGVSQVVHLRVAGDIPGAAAVDIHVGRVNTPRQGGAVNQRQRGGGLRNDIRDRLQAVHHQRAVIKVHL